MSTLPAAVPSQDIFQKAKDTFEVLKTGFTNDHVTNYWQVGNAAGTMIDWYRTVGFVDLKFICTKHQWFVDKGLTNNLWFDDYLWWACAALKGGTLSSPNLMPPWDKVFQFCWAKAHPALSVWKDAVEKYHKFQEYRPRVEKGVWNASWSKYGPWRNDKDETQSLLGIQNAVVNSLYLVAAGRAGYLKEDYAKAALDEYVFMRNWFNVRPETDSLLLRFTASGEQCSLVRERVSTFYDLQKDPYYNPNFYWTGDQGLFLGAMQILANMPTVPGSLKPELIRFATEIISAVKEKLIKGQELLPWSPGQQVPGGDTADYSSGPGVFMRYLLHAWRWEPLKAHIKKLGLEKLVPIMAANVPEPKKPPITNDDLNSLTNNLATLLAAIEMQRKPVPA